MISNKPRLLKYSRELRSNMTDSEIILWRYLRKKQILGIKFTRQKPIGNYIADFYASSINLVIEIDGEGHFSQQGLLDDSKRDDYLNNLSLTVLRFTNLDIFKNLSVVLDEIYRICKTKLTEK